MLMIENYVDLLSKVCMYLLKTFTKIGVLLDYYYYVQFIFNVSIDKVIRTRTRLHTLDPSRCGKCQTQSVHYSVYKVYRGWNQLGSCLPQTDFQSQRTSGLYYKYFVILKLMFLFFIIWFKFEQQFWTHNLFITIFLLCLSLKTWSLRMR